MDDTPVDPDVFTFTGSSLKVQTDDSTKAKLYNLKVTATLVDYNTNIRSKDFDVEVLDFCEETQDITATSLANQEYSVSAPAVTTVAFAAFPFTPTYCPFTYDFLVTPALPAPDTGAIAFDAVARTFTFYSTNLDLVNLYTVTVFLKTPLGVDTGFFFEYDVDFKDPCLISVLTIAQAILDPLPYEYILEQAAATRLLSDVHISETETVANCPTVFEYKLEKANGDPLAADSIVLFDDGANEISVESSDRADLALSPI